MSSGTCAGILLRGGSAMAESKFERIGRWAAALGPARLAMGGMGAALGFAWLGAMVVRLRPDLMLSSGAMSAGGGVATVIGLAAAVGRSRDRKEGAARAAKAPLAFAFGVPWLLMLFWSFDWDAPWRPASAHDFAAVTAAVLVIVAAGDVLTPAEKAEPAPRRRDRDIGAIGRTTMLTLDRGRAGVLYKIGEQA